MASWAIGSVAMGVPASLSRTTTVYRPSSRAVSASLGASALAGLAVGHANWDTVLLRLGVFLASTIRGKPPQLARQFVEGESAIEEGLLVLLRREGDQLVGLRPVAVGDFLPADTGVLAKRVSRRSALVGYRHRRPDQRGPAHQRRRIGSGQSE